MKNALEQICRDENINLDILQEKIKEGKVVVPLNISRKHISSPTAIGEGLTVKVNANIGGSPDISDVKLELTKLKVAVECGADTVMDLTIDKSWKEILQMVLDASDVPVGTVPVYAAICDKGTDGTSADDFINIVKTQAELGVDFMTIHSGVTKDVIRVYDSASRIGGMVSRGGNLLMRWMKKNNQENPFYERFDEILDIARTYNVTLSLGDGLRPGCIADASDNAQYAELEVLGELAKRCRSHGVGVMIEGPGHVPLDMIEENVKKEKEICDGAPFYVLGPLTTDIGAGFDHIVGAIGGALAAWKGADFLCYLTPAEHIHLPDIEDVIQGVVASKIAAHSADIARHLPGARRIDDKMSHARRNLNWKKMEEYALNSFRLKEIRKKYPSRSDDACTMCGEYCALLEE